MRRIVVLGLLCVALVGCKRVREKLAQERVERAERAELARQERAQRPVPPPPDGPGLPPGTYRITSLSVAAMTTKDNGAAWDGDHSAPDLTAELFVDGVLVYSCRLPDDARSGACPLEVDVPLTASSEILVQAIDRDLSADDLVGAARLTDPSRWGLRIPLTLVPADPGQIEQASITIGPGPSWWAQHGGTVFRAGMATAIALAMFALWRVHRSHRSARAAAPAPQAMGAVDEIRCPHCDKRIPRAADVCGHCGARQ